MTDNPWLSQPDTTPYPTTIGARVKAGRAAREAELAEAERRGAERGWQESVEWFAGLGGNVRVPDRVLQEAEADNPYRPQSPPEAATAPPEPVQPPGDHQDTTEPTGGAQ